MIPALQQDEPSFARMVRGRHPVRRANLIALSRRWQMQQEARQREAQARFDALGRAVERFEPARVCRPPRPAHEVIKRVAARHRMLVEELLSPSRKHQVIAARFDAIVEVYQTCRIGERRLSLPEIGRLFRRDHTSILSALRRRGVA